METLTPAEEEALADRVVRNQLAIQELQEENDRLKMYWKQDKTAFPAGKTIELGKYKVKITENKRMDTTLARQELGDRTFERVSKRVIDPALAKSLLTPDIQKKITKVFDNKIEVTLK